MTQPQACPFEADLKALLDGELLDLRRHQMERHLAECANCATLHRDLRQLSQEVHAMSEPASCPESVTQRVLCSLPERGPNRLRFLEFSFVRWAAAGGLATVMGAILVAILMPVFSTAREKSRYPAMAGRAPASSGPYLRDDAASPASSPALAPPPAVAPGGGMGGPARAESMRQRTAGFPLKATAGADMEERHNGDFYEDGKVKGRAKLFGQTTDDVNKYVHGNEVDQVLRKVVKTASLSVLVNERLETLQDRIAKKVTAEEGYTESMDLSSPPTGSRTTQMALRVPVAKFESTIEYLSGLGEVKSKSLGGKDITGTWLEERKNVRDLRKKEERYAAAYRNARNATERERARRQLLNLRPVLQSSEEQFAETAKLAALAKIDLTLIEEPQAKIRGDLGRDLQNTTKQASATFLMALRVPATLLIWLAIFTPLWLPCLIAYRWATRMARRQQSIHTDMA